MRQRSWDNVLRLAGFGWFVAISISGGLLLGIWLDARFHTRVLFTLLGLFAGLALAAVGLYQMLVPFLKTDGRGRPRRGAAKPPKDG